MITSMEFSVILPGGVPSHTVLPRSSFQTMGVPRADIKRTDS